MHYPDSRRSWCVCFAAVLSSIIVHGCSFSYSVLFPVLLDEFGEGKAKTAWVGSLAMAGFGLFAPVAGKLNDRFGERVLAIFGTILCAAGLLLSSQASNINVLFITFGGITGFGSSCALLSMFMIVSRYFVKKRSFAMGFMSLGSAGGTALMNPLVQCFLNVLNWKHTFVAIAGVAILVCLLAILFDPNVMDVTFDHVKCVLQKEFQEKPTTRGILTSLMKNSLYLIAMFAFVVGYFGHMMPSVHLVRHCEDVGITASRASRLYLFFGLASAIARVATGRVYDVGWMKPLYLLQLALAVSGVSTLLLPFATSYTWLVLYSIFYGLGDGVLGSNSFVLPAKVLPEEERSLGFGVLSFAVCFSYFGGPPLAGFVADTVGSYKPAFFMAGSLCIFAAVSISLASVFKSAEENSISQNRQNDVLIVLEKMTVV